MPMYGIGMDRIISLHELVSNAIILDGQFGTETDEETNQDD
jgi:hypothetical protein